MIERLLDDDALRARLGRGARAFAERSFSWPASAGSSAASTSARSARVAVRSRNVSRRRNGSSTATAARVPPRLSYATVRDYCDSADRLPGSRSRTAT